MALIRCSECKAKISNKAVSCPKCGAPVEATKVKKKHSGCLGVIVLLFLVFGVIGIISSSVDKKPKPKPSSPASEALDVEKLSVSKPVSVATEKPTARSATQASKQKILANDYMVRVAVWDDTKSRPVHSRAEIWFRGVGSWWLKPEMKYGGTSKDLGVRPKGIEHTLIIYPESRNGKEIKVPYMMTDKMNPKGSPRDMIQVSISDTTITVNGLPIKAATGTFELKYPR